MQEFLDLGECTITESETEDKDWINNWKQYFKQFYVDDILIIVLGGSKAGRPG